VLGVPVGDFGLFASTLIALALGFITFFGATFLIISLAVLLGIWMHRRITAH